MIRVSVRRTAAPAVALLLLLLFVGCGAGKDQNKGIGNTMDKWHVNDECDFGALEEGLLSENACSPEIDDPDFQGIAINAPEEVLYHQGETIPGSSAFADVRVCGTGCFDHGFMGLGGEVHGAILLVAVDAATQETFSGKMTAINNPVPPPDELPQGGPTEGLLIESYFNPNLVEVLELPERPAEYIVYAVLGEHKSNTVRIRVKERS